MDILSRFFRKFDHIKFYQENLKEDLKKIR